MADDKFHCIILKGGDQYPYFPRPLLSEFDFSIPISSAPKVKEAKAKQRKKKKKDGEDLDIDNLDADMDDDDENNDDNDKDDADDSDVEVEPISETRKLEQAYLLQGVQAAQVRDLMEATAGNHTQRSQLSRLELEIDKTLLQLLAVECREGGEERGMRALEMVTLMRDRTGRMMEAAGKVAERYGRTVLGDKIREVGEKRVSGEEDEDF